MKNNAIKTRHILPGYSFQLSKKNYFGVKQYCKFKNGLPIVEKDFPPMNPNELENVPDNPDIKIDPVLMYGTLKKPRKDIIVPKYIKYNGMTLVFRGYIVPANESSHLVERTMKRDNGEMNIITKELCLKELEGTTDEASITENESAELLDDIKDNSNQTDNGIITHEIFFKKLSKETIDAKNESLIVNNESGYVKEKRNGKEISSQERNFKELIADELPEVEDKDKREVVVVYYLEDDTVEIIEKVLGSLQYGKTFIKLYRYIYTYIY